MTPTPKTLTLDEIEAQAPAEGTCAFAYWSVLCCWWSTDPADLADVGAFRDLGYVGVAFVFQADKGQTWEQPLKPRRQVGRRGSRDKEKEGGK